MSSYPPIAPSTAAPTPPPSMSASDESPRPSKVSKKCRKSAGNPPSKLGPNGSYRKSEKLHRRSRSGCYTCRLRRKKCDEGKTSCRACKNLKLQCEYSRPPWWGNSEQRKTQKEIIKNRIKDTKLNEKSVAAAARSQGQPPSPPSLSHSAPTPETFGEGLPFTREVSLEPKYAPVDSDFNQFHADQHDPFLCQLETPRFDSTQFWASVPPYEVDVKTEREVYVDDVPMRRDSSISTFSTYQPPFAHSTLPVFTGDDWLNRDFLDTHKETGVEPEIHGYSSFESPHAHCQVAPVQVEECDQHLLDHFFEKVLPLIFPLLEAKQHGTVRSDVVLPAIESNKPYLHGCLGTAAAHLKLTHGLPADEIDYAILRHRYLTVSELSSAMNHDPDHGKIVEATLALIFFQCAVGSPDDSLPEIPWHQHFHQAANSLVHRLDQPNQLREPDKSKTLLQPFNIALSAWIDILGSTMLGQMPRFAHSYRSNLLNGSSSGLCDLMGCEDRVMYLIAEISCLDSLKSEGRVDYNTLCSHITTLGQQLDHAEPPTASLAAARSESGSVNLDQLSKNITALFCVAARVYLCTLVPGADRYQPNAINLVAHAADILELIPTGPDGFDRSLVWPLLICGAFSTPNTQFRRVLQDRIALLGNQSAFGSFGRMVHLLQEVWQLSDSQTTSSSASGTSGLVGTADEAPFLPTPENSVSTTPDSVGITGRDEPQQSMDQTFVRWRDVMQRNGWDYLLI